MKREKVIELVKAAGNEGNFACGTIIINGRDSDDWVMEFARLVEQETLERASGACDEFAGSQIDAAKQSGDSYCNLRASGAHACSMRIRNLKDNHDKE